MVLMQAKLVMISVEGAKGGKKQSESLLVDRGALQGP